MTGISPKVAASGGTVRGWGWWLFWALCVASGHAKTIYVSPNGNDANAGTANLPYRSVARGVSEAAPGDTILLKDGVYGSHGFVSDGTGGWHGYATPVPITKSGTPSAWITIRAEHKRAAILNCETSDVRLGCDVYIYLRSTAAYWSFEDLVVTGGAYAGINTNEGAHHVRIIGCEFSHIGNRPDYTRIGIVGVGFGLENATNWWIEGNVFHDIGRTGGEQRNLDHAIYAGGSDATIIRNIFYRNVAGWHIQTTRGARRWTVANNTFALPSSRENGHMMLWDGDVPGSISDIEIRNNIFFNVRGPAIVSRATSLAGCVIENNLTDSASIFDQRSNCETRGNKVGVDPEFMNASKEPFDFRLKELSPAIGAGVGGVDLGAIRQILGMKSSR